MSPNTTTTGSSEKDTPNLILTHSNYHVWIRQFKRTVLKAGLWDVFESDAFADAIAKHEAEI